MNIETQIYMKVMSLINDLVFEYQLSFKGYETKFKCSYY